MSPEDFKRKLTAVFSADVAGYSRLMGDDEAATVKTLEAYKQVMFTLIKQHRGRVVDSTGDNLLAEFGSVVDAVQCGVAVQNELKARNADLPENRRMQFRIGINLGDVIEEGERIYGDGVNIAARLEALAEPGGICVSKTAFDHIETKLPLGFEFLGEQEVKNITKPVGAYKVLMEPRIVDHRIKDKKHQIPFWRRRAFLVVTSSLIVVIVAGVIWWVFFHQHFPPASEENMVFPLPDKPSIAVLPFENLSDDKQQRFFCDGLTDEIITALSKTPKMFVIAPDTMFSFQGKEVKIGRVAEKLGVKYVLEGSVGKAGDRVRIWTQLSDALSGRHLWAEQYDREMKDIFSLQDEITIKIISDLHVKLTDGEVAGLKGRGTQNLDAYLKVLQARGHFFTVTKEGMVQARRLCEEAIELDPNYAKAYGFLGSTHWMETLLGSSKFPQESLKLAFKFLEKAKALLDSIPFPQLGYLYVITGQYDKGIEECERSLAHAPNSSRAHIWMAMVLNRMGNHEEAVPYAERALRLDPLAPAWYLRTLGQTYSWVGRYEEAIAKFKKSLQQEPNDIFTHESLTIAYTWAGRLEEARAQAAEVLRINPKTSVEQRTKRLAYKNEADRKRYLDGLRKAGLPETPPLTLPDKPSIAVLPFVNISGDPEQEYFSDGITDDLITDLSKIAGLFVIARNSVFQYKGKPVDVKKISRELGVRYLLEGSVRRANNQVRINAQLIDVTSGGHLWAERYDGALGDVFALQDRITRKIVSALAVKLTAGEENHVTRMGTENVQAYDAFLKGWEHYRRFTEEDFDKAVHHLEKAIELDPNYGRAYAALALVYWRGAFATWHKSLGKGKFYKAIALGHKYLEMAMKTPTSLAHRLTSEMSLLYRRYDEAVAEAERAIALDPNDPEGYENMARALIYDGRPEEGVEFIKKGMRLDPHSPGSYLAWLGMAHFAMGQLEEAVSLSERALRHRPEDYRVLTFLAAAYAHLGREQESRTAINSLQRAAHWAGLGRPLFSWMRRFPFKDLDVSDRLAEGLDKAGFASSLDYYRLSEKDKLTEEEIRALVSKSQYTKERFWIEGGLLCDRMRSLHGKYCATVFRNPKVKNDYILVSDFGIYHWSPGVEVD